MPDPYISVVVAARNDNHGGNMLGRMQAFLDSWIVQAQRLQLDSEIVIVEWNPPVDRPPLRDELQLPESDRCEVTFVQVPAEVHAGIPNAAAIPLHQMIAKNVGIRRARGQFVLATNLDIVFSRELMEFLAERRLESSVLYRMDRYDVASDLPPSSAGIDGLLDHCRSRVLRVFAAENQLRFENGEQVSTEADDIAADGLDFGRGWMPLERQHDFRYRWMLPPARILFRRPPGACLRMDAEIGPSQGGESLSVEVLDDSKAVVAHAEIASRCRLLLQFPVGMSSGEFWLNFAGRNIPLCPDLRFLHLRVTGMAWEPANFSAGWDLQFIDTAPARDWRETPSAPAPRLRHAAWLHVNACGDFTLLSREDWFHLRGYAELPIWPIHVDTLLCYAAHHWGMREQTLRDPMRIFHIEHGSAAGWSPEGEEALRRRIMARQVPVLDFDADIGRWVQQMRRWDAPVIFNLEDWGLAGKL